MREKGKGESMGMAAATFSLRLYSPVVRLDSLAALLGCLPARVNTPRLLGR